MEYAADAVKADVDTYKGQTNYTLALIAGDSARAGESTTANWKTFDPAATKLSIEYNTPPTAATAAQMTVTPDYTAAASACVTGTGRPVLRSTKPWLKAVLADADGSGGGSLRADFTLQKLSGSTCARHQRCPRPRHRRTHPHRRRRYARPHRRRHPHLLCACRSNAGTRTQLR